MTPILLGARAARARAGDRARGDVACRDGEQRLRACAGDLEIAEVQEIHVGTWVDGAQASVYGEPLDGHLRREALRRHDLESVARIDVLDDPRHHRFKVLARHVRLKARRRARASFRTGRHRAGQACPHFGDRACRCLVGPLRVRLGVEVGVGHDRDRVLEMIERDERIGEHQAPCPAGRASSVARLAQRLDRTHEVIAKETYGASHERKPTHPVGQRRLASNQLPRRPPTHMDRRHRQATSATPSADGSR